MECRYMALPLPNIIGFVPTTAKDLTSSVLTAFIWVAITSFNWIVIIFFHYL